MAQALLSPTPMRLRPTPSLSLLLVTVTFALQACGGYDESDRTEAEPDELYASVQEGLTSCQTRTDTGYVKGSAFTITVVTVDSKPVEVDTANAFTVMQDAARAQGVNIVVISGFRTNAEQQYLYGCYVNCNCNSCNLAAAPGQSNHQSGHALDLNTSAPGVYNWLANNAGAYGFKRTVPSEAWHWEWWGGGPGGGACSTTADNCTVTEKNNCGAFGCGCVDHQCNGGACAGSGCSAQHTTNCGAFGCGCADGTCGGAFCPGNGCSAKETADCGKFGCGCVDHKCSGGFCAGSGSTARNVLDCGNYGCHSVDGKCSGGFCPGSGCTAKQTADCAAQGQGCVDEKCSDGCTARQTLDCAAADAGCARGACVSGAPPTTLPTVPDGGTVVGAIDELAPTEAPPSAAELSATEPIRIQSVGNSTPEAVTGGCSATGGSGALLLALLLARRRKR